MVKGCQKRTVHIRDTGSKYYEEAFFILKPGAFDPESQGDMLEEAIRIAEETLSSSLPEKEKKKKRHKRDFALLASGFGIGAVISAIIIIITLL